MSKIDGESSSTTSLALWLVIGVPIGIVSVATLLGWLLREPLASWIGAGIAGVLIAPVTSYMVARRIVHENPAENPTTQVIFLTLLLMLAQWAIALLFGFAGCTAVLQASM